MCICALRDSGARQPRCYSARALRAPVVGLAPAFMIYLVEDNDALRSSLIAMLKEFVRMELGGSSGTEQEATDWLQGHREQWRLAVVDLFLLQGSGLGVVSSLRERQPWQKIVVLTNYATPDIRRRSLALGADAVFDKGKELDEFFAYCSELAPRPSSSQPHPTHPG